MLYLFDLDDTLISGYMDNPDKGYHKYRILPGRYEKLLDLRTRGDRICIATNQAGVAHGFITEEDVDFKMRFVLAQIGLFEAHTNSTRPIVYSCYYDTRGRPPWNDPIGAARRKPSGAMLREAMRDYPIDAALGVLYVGDRPEDQAAAQDAGVAFQWAHIYFKDQ